MIGPHALADMRRALRIRPVNRHGHIVFPGSTVREGELTSVFVSFYGGGIDPVWTSSGFQRT